MAYFELFLRVTNNEWLALIFLRMLNADMMLLGIFALLFGASLAEIPINTKIRSTLFAFGGMLSIIAILTDKTATGVRYIEYCYL